jgi:formylglycine-generating enzyme required for sulfatase activity
MKLFISYRRANWSFTYWLAEELSKLLDAEIFVDYTGIDESDFESSLLRNLRESDAVVLVVSDQTFETRIHHDKDWVRREIREALDANIPIALAMVNGLMPPTDLPNDIQPIRGKQGIEFYPRFFKAGVQELAAFIDRATPIRLRSEVVTAPSGAPTAATTDKALFERGITLCEAGKYDEAIELFDTLIAKKYKAFIAVEHLREKAIEDRDLEQRRWEAGEAYDQLVAAFRLMPARVATSYEEFKTAYPEFRDDPAALSVKIAMWHDQQKPKPAPKPPIVVTSPKPDPVSEQKRLLAIMLDPNRPPDERARAGREINNYGDPRPGVIDFNFKIGEYWCEVPAGEFIMGSDEHEPEKPMQVKFLPAFYIAKYPITWQQFEAFVTAEAGYRRRIWWNGLHNDSFAQRKNESERQNRKYNNHPCENVSWYDAVAFTRWLSTNLRYTITLPTETQWEKAARGTDGRTYPWGDKYRNGYANVNEIDEKRKPDTHFLKTTTPVGIYPEGESPCCALDMSGNVWEWMLDEYQTRSSSDLSNNYWRSLRGGSFYNDPDYARTAYRIRNYPDYRSEAYGFRIVCSAPAP